MRKFWQKIFSNLYQFNLSTFETTRNLLKHNLTNKAGSNISNNSKNLTIFERYFINQLNWCCVWLYSLKGLMDKHVTLLTVTKVHPSLYILLSVCSLALVSTPNLSHTWVRNKPKGLKGFESSAGGFTNYILHSSHIMFLRFLRFLCHVSFLAIEMKK